MTPAYEARVFSGCDREDGQVELNRSTIKDIEVKIVGENPGSEVYTPLQEGGFYLVNGKMDGQ